MRQKVLHLEAADHYTYCNISAAYRASPKEIYVNKTYWDLEDMPWSDFSLCKRCVRLYDKDDLGLILLKMFQ